MSTADGNCSAGELPFCRMMCRSASLHASSGANSLADSQTLSVFPAGLFRQVEPEFPIPWRRQISLLLTENHMITSSLLEIAACRIYQSRSLCNHTQSTRSPTAATHLLVSSRNAAHLWPRFFGLPAVISSTKLVLMPADRLPFCDENMTEAPVDGKTQAMWMTERRV